jgi:hypothetical protein
VKTMPLKEFRSRLGITVQFKEYFSFAVKSQFSRKIALEDESNTKLSYALLNFMEVVNNNNTRSDRNGEIKDKKLKLFLFLEPFDILPTFKTTKKYFDCLMKLYHLQHFIESLKVLKFFEAAFHFDPNE